MANERKSPAQPGVKPQRKKDQTPLRGCSPSSGPHRKRNRRKIIKKRKVDDFETPESTDAVQYETLLSFDDEQNTEFADYPWPPK